MLFFSQFKNILIQILLIATLLSAFLGHAVESIAIAVIVLFAVILSFVQEYRAERSIEAAASYGRSDCQCRAKRRKKIPARGLSQETSF